MSAPLANASPIATTRSDGSREAPITAPITSELEATIPNTNALTTTVIMRW